MKKQLEFNPLQHGWHFPNQVSTDAGIRTYGLCGGMCLSAFNYFRHHITIPRLRYEDISAENKVLTPAGEMINVPLTQPGKPHPVFDFILHSQLACYPFMIRQVVFFLADTDQNHHNWSIRDEFPQIREAIMNDHYVLIGLRNAKPGDLMGHQVLVTGFDDDACTLFLYDPNYPDVPCAVRDNGSRIEWGKIDMAGNFTPFPDSQQYRSYYVQLVLDPNCTSTHTTYDVLRNGNDNFAVKPTYVDPVYVDLAGVRTGLPRERVIATPAATRRR